MNWMLVRSHKSLMLSGDNDSLLGMVPDAHFMDVRNRAYEI